MQIYQKILKGTSFLSIAEIANQGCSLLRNIILARFLTKADFGVAALLAMVLSLFELSGKLALSQQVIQSKHGDDPRFVSSVQFTQFAAGTIGALLILAAAWPLAHFFSGPQYFTSIMALALVPFINGLINLDVYRYSRQLKFGPMVLTDLIPQIATTLAAWPLAVYFKDYRAVLVILLGKACFTATMTHWLAERQYSLRYDSIWLRESFKFAWPLLLTSFIMIANFQGDSMVVAASYPLAELGVYAVALAIAVTPGYAVLRIGSSLGLPLLAEVQFDKRLFSIRYSQLAQCMALIGCLATLGMLFCGEEVVAMLFGSKYAGIGALACLLTAAQSMRILRGAPITAAMARGDTVNNLVSNLWRLSGLLLAIIIGVVKASLLWFAAAAFFGELVSLIATTIRLSSKQSVKPNLTIKPALLGTTCVLCAAALKWGFNVNSSSVFNWLLLPVFMILSAGAFMFCFSEFRSSASGFVRHLRIKRDLSTGRETNLVGPTSEQILEKNSASETTTILK